MKSAVLLPLALAVMLAPMQAGAAERPPRPSPVVVTLDVPVSTDVADVPHSETAIAVNPRNPQNVLASSFAVENARMVTMVYYSFDGGRTWKRALFPRPDRVHFPNTWDPVLAFGPDGVGYFITETQFRGFWVTATRDGGLTWSTPTLHKRLYMYDRSYASIGEGRWSGRLFVAGYSRIQLGTRDCCGGVVIQTSDDRGASFAAARAHICDRNVDCELSPAAFLARSDGAVFEFESANGSSSGPDGVSGGGYYIVPSFDGGFSWLAGRKIADFETVTSMQPDGKNKQKFFNVSDGTAAIDESAGPYRNRMYFAYNTWNGRRYVTELIHSTDDWAGWSRPMVVDDVNGGGDDVLSGVAVNRNGVVAVIWYDRRQSLSRCYQLAAAVSYDGGESFSRNYLHPGITCASNPRDIQYYTVETGSFGRQGPLGLSISRTSDTKFSSGGDTIGLSANGDSFDVVWANGASGVQQLWYTAFRPRSGHLLAARPRGRPTARPRSAGLRLAPVLSNLNEGLQLDPVPSYDRSRHTVTFVMRIRNRYPVPVRGPFVLTEVEGKRWNPDIDAPVESDAPKGTHVAPFWVFHVPGEVLAPGAETLPRTMTWRVNDARPTPYVDLNVTRGR